MLEMVCGESPTIWASSTRLRPPEDLRMASRMTVRLKSPIRGRLVPRLGEGWRISDTVSPNVFGHVVMMSEWYVTA